MFRSAGRANAGFSLVELMVVVSIIGVLATLAIPRFKVFTARAKQTEAKLNLAHMFTLQVAYKQTDPAEKFGAVAPIAPDPSSPNACNKPNVIGFQVEDCVRLNYTYEATTASANTFKGTATSGKGPTNKIWPDCPTEDIWTVDEKKTILVTQDAVGRCST